MSFSVFLSFITYALIISYSPGPANLLSFHTSSQYGFRSFLKIWAGLFSGFVTDMFCCCFLTFFLSQLVPQITQVLTYLGALYMLWLAWHIFRSNSTQTNDTQTQKKKEPSFLVGYLLNITNVKIILYGLTIYQIYLLPAQTHLSILMVLAIPLSMIGASSCLLWAIGGRLFSKFFTKYSQICNVIMSLLLVWCVISLFTHAS